MSMAQPIEQPGVVLNATLAEILDLSRESEAVKRWEQTIADLDANERRALQLSEWIYVEDLKSRSSFDHGTAVDAFRAGWAAGK